MATRACRSIALDNGFRVLVWEGLLNGDVGEAAIPDFDDNSCVAVLGGVLGVGGNLQMKQSVDGVTWVNFGSGIATLGGAATLTPLPRFIRPEVTAGDASTNITTTVHGPRKGI